MLLAGAVTPIRNKSQCLDQLRRRRRRRIEMARPVWADKREPVSKGGMSWGGEGLYSHLPRAIGQSATHPDVLTAL